MSKILQKIMTNPTFKYSLYQIPTCSKCRGSIHLLQEELKLDSAQLNTINYTEDPPTEQDLKNIIKLLNTAPESLLRDDTKKSLLEKQGKIELQDIVKSILQDPMTMQRPVFINWEKQVAVIARPVDKIHSIL